MPAKRQAVSRKPSKSANPYWHLLGEMEKKIGKSLKKLTRDFELKKDLKTIQKDNTDLLLLVGECNYIKKECQKLKKKTKR